MASIGQIAGQMIGQNVAVLLDNLMNESQAHADTIGLLQQIKAGEIKIEDVTITDGKWKVNPPKPDLPKANTKVS